MSLLGLFLKSGIPYSNPIGDPVGDFKPTGISEDACHDMSDIFERMFDE